MSRNEDRLPPSPLSERFARRTETREQIEERVEVEEMGEEKEIYGRVIEFQSLARNKMRGQQHRTRSLQLMQGSGSGSGVGSGICGGGPSFKPGEPRGCAKVTGRRPLGETGEVEVDVHFDWTFY